ncbi:uncharacterized protein LOC122525081 isoform X8 [Polistes fuscatus]|uniref:uncharacterized protein LOC122525081 isoform X8 n=1 Tax=Polistes fuscatus TaxID=30207 RepID=UPI001CA8015D|nr:uncharacterized protein LOC122525081 isoform X8 [Polistes fuscatus]
MAEVATKKSISVVSNKKNEVCGVQSNNGLIELDNLTASNKQLISLCDNNDDEDDLVLTNNTRNELDTEDKSLQELIDSELALRICSPNEEEVEEDEQEEKEVGEENDDVQVVEKDNVEEESNQPDAVKRIVLDRHEDPFRVNTDFIVAELEHCALIEEPYGYQNGHVSPETHVKPDQMNETKDELEERIFDEGIEDNVAVVQKTNVCIDEIDRGKIDERTIEEDENDFFLKSAKPDDDQLAVIESNRNFEDVKLESDEIEIESCQVEDKLSSPVPCQDKHQQEEESIPTKFLLETNEKLIETERDDNQTQESKKSIELPDTWTEQLTPDNQQLGGQFSDNFDDETTIDKKSDKESSSIKESNSGITTTEYFQITENNETLEESMNNNDGLIKIEESPQDVSCTQSRSFDDVTLSQSETSTDAASTQEFIDMERRVLNEESSSSERNNHDDTKFISDSDNIKNESTLTYREIEESEVMNEDDIQNESLEILDNDNNVQCPKSESTILLEKTEVVVSETNVTIFSETKRVELMDNLSQSDNNQTHKFDSWMTVEEATRIEEEEEKADKERHHEEIRTIIKREDTNQTNVTDNDRSTQDDDHHHHHHHHHLASSPRAPLATPDDETSDIINVCDTRNYVSEANRNEQERSNKERIATGVSIKQLCRSFGDISNMSDADQATFGRTNSVEIEEKAKSMGDLRVCEKGFSKFCKDPIVFAGVSVKTLRASYCSLANLTSEGKMKDRVLGRPRFEKSSFNKFDALSKKTVLHVRSVDAGKVQQQLNAVGQNGEAANQNCRSCNKVVFQMEQTKAEGLVWHKNCFRCVQCSKQLNVDNYESHESTLYCKPHFKELFQPKPVEESDQPVRPRKPELIIRENEPKELPPDVVRASDKPDLGLEELSSLNVKSRFQVFEKAGTENTNEIEKSPSQIAVKRSPSILSKLAKFQAKGMDIGVADESLNGIPYEESSESEEEDATEEIEEIDTEIVKAKRTTRERPISFSKMDDIKNRWESTSQQGRREVQREARKEEIAGIRSRLFMGKQGKMKEMYQQAVAGSERVTKINAAEEIQHSTHARSIKERFERGEPIAASDDETDNTKPKPEKADEEVIAAGISRKSRSLFLELDASAAKTGRPVTPVNPKTPADTPRRARDAFMVRQVSDDVVRSSDTTEEVHVETSDISNKFKFFESYKEPEKQRKQFRITPPRDGQVKMDSPEREIYRDPDVVRADDRVDEVVHTDTARKMLSIFRQMEENACKEELPEGPKPLKRFTPPPEDKFAKQTASDSEEEEEEEGEESEADESAEERDPNYVRASDKVEDEFLKQAQNAARAKTLRAKFEHWEETDGKPSNHNIAEMEIAQSTGDQSSIESASSLRARFESLGSQTNESPRAPKIKVNRFVEIQASCTDVCESCEKKVYPLEKVETNNKIFHKQCFRCLQCNCVLRMDTFTLNNGKLYCIPHFKQLFITRGNYDEGFGVDPHKNKWATSNSNQANVSPIAVSNGDL